MKLQQLTTSAISLAMAVLVGHVSDATTDQPLPNVAIAVGSHRTTTDASGNYRIAGLKPGHYKLSASSNDVPPQYRSVTVSQRPKTTLDLVLCDTTLDYSCATGDSPL